MAAVTERASPAGGPSGGAARGLFPEGAVCGRRDALRSAPRGGDIRLCSARARVSRAPTGAPVGEEEMAPPLLPHVGPQMTGNFLYAPYRCLVLGVPPCRRPC